MLKKTVSDSLAKTQCKKYLENLGFENLHPARGNSCDLIGYKNNKQYYFEIKYSSKSHGDFFGCVMFSELFQAISNKKNYYFIVCRKNKKINNWFYRLFTTEQFLEFCTLTTPIGHYRLIADNNGALKKANIGKKSVIVTERMILDIWKKFREWKPQ